MPDLTISVERAVELLRQDGRFDALLTGKRAYSVKEFAELYLAATGVPISADTVTRWFRHLQAMMAARGKPLAVEKYEGTLGWYADRDALVLLLGQRIQAQMPDGDAEEAGA